MTCIFEGLLGNKRSTSRRRWALISWRIAAAGLSVVSTCAGADRSWGNTGGGTFSVTTNWVNGLLAGVNDVAVFDRSRGTSQTTYTVSFGSSVQNQAVSVTNDLVTFNLGGRTYTTTQITGNEIGTSSSTALQARLTVNNGTFNVTGALTPQLVVGAAPGAVGALTLTNGAMLTGSPRLLVGSGSATGGFTVNTGTATLNTLDVGSGAGGRGSVFMTLPFSAITSGTLLVGNAGIGTMTVDTGALLTNNGPATIGNTSGSSGLITLDGGVTRWIQNGSMVIGHSGAGTVNVTGGGSLSAMGEDVTIGNNLGSIGRLLLSGDSSRARMGQLVVGSAGVGIMHVSGGASVSSSTSNFVSVTGNGFVDISAGGAWFSGGTTTIAHGLNSVGRLDVRGTGSRWSCGTLLIGNRGNGRLNITDGATASAGGNVTLGFDASGAGTVNVDGVGSTWNIFAGTLSVGRNGSGHMQITNGGRVQSLDSQINGPGSVLVQGQDSTWVTDGLELAGTVGTLVVNSGGIVDSSRGEVPSLVGGTGAATISGAGSQWRISTTLFVGENTFGPTGSVGSLTIADDALVDVIGSAFVGENGTIILNGGTLRVANLTLDSTSTFQFDAGLLRITGNPSMSAAFLDKLFGPTHTLAAERHLSVGGTPTLTSLLVLDGGILTVPTLAVGSPLQFDSGSFNLTSDNLTIGSGGLLGSTLTLDDRNVNVTNSTTIDSDGQLIFRGGTFFSGRGITNNGQIIVDLPASFRGAVNTFVNPIINNGELRVLDGAGVDVSGNITGTGSITGGGAKVFKSGSNSSVGALDSSGSTIVEAGAVLNAGRIREQSLTVNGNVNTNPGGTDASTSRLNALSVTGRLDLANNALVIDYTAASPLVQISGFIQSGFAGGSWSGQGINSSIAASIANRALGFAEATDIGSPATFAGQSIDSTSVLVQFTLPGDANLDRTVNISDFALLAANFNTPSRWSRGDFNYSGSTEIGDFALLAANFNLSLPSDIPRGGNVPEPACIGAIIALAATRRRKTSKS